MLTTVLKGLVFLIGGLLTLALLVLLVFWWSSANAEQSNAECSMLIIEKNISPANVATEYRRACMASKGYGMQAHCYVDKYSAASCFIPRWIFWINTV